MSWPKFSTPSWGCWECKECKRRFGYCCIDDSELWVENIVTEHSCIFCNSDLTLWENLGTSCRGILIVEELYE